jgi:integrase
MGKVNCRRSVTAIEAIRAHLIELGRCRNSINKDIARIKRAFRWGATKKMVPVAVYQELCTLEGLRAGRSPAVESKPVRPVAVIDVDATLPFLTSPVRAMAQLQLCTGMRPGEVTATRTIDIDTSGKTWRYRPGSDQGPHGAHKNAWRGQDRVVILDRRRRSWCGRGCAST